jgi:protein ImuB
MASRLGLLSIVRTKFVNSHIPERAAKLEPVISRTADDIHAKPDPQLKRPLRLLPQPELITVLFAEVPDGPPPGMVWRRVGYTFVKASGPERIGVEWWSLSEALVALPKLPEKEEDAGKEVTEAKEEYPEVAINDGLAFTRDYFIAEDEDGRRFWVFREGLYAPGAQPRWYMHGFFA